MSQNLRWTREQLLATRAGQKTLGAVAPVAVAKRLRVETPMNKSERELFEYLKRAYPGSIVRAQSIRIRLGNFSWFKPDTSVSAGFDGRPDGRMSFWEFKGDKKARWSRGGEDKIKHAATAYPEFRFVLAWKEDGQMKFQEIQP